MSKKQPKLSLVPSAFAVPNYYGKVSMGLKPAEVPAAPAKTGKAVVPWEQGSTVGPLPEPVQESHMHRVVITGRGQAAGRAAKLMRLRPDVVSEIKALVDGPLYLTIELALRFYAKHLSDLSPDVKPIQIKAADLN